MCEPENSTDLISTPLSATALPQPNSFVDGDWVESEWIVNSGIRLVQTGNIGVGVFLNKANHARFIAHSSFTKLGCKWVHPGDILICRLADPIGRACEVPSEVGNCITSVDCTIFRPDPGKMNKRFAVQLLNSASHLKKLMDMAGGSTRQRISRSALGAVQISIPPIKKQTVIAFILDTVDEAIRRTEALIAKLRQVKAGMLHDLLTRGLDDNDELRDPIRHPEQFKDSPLGRIPKEWDVQTFGNACEKIQDGTHFSPTSISGPCLYITSKNIRFGYMDLADVGWISQKEHEAIYRRCDVKAGDVLLTKDGASTGNATINEIIEPFSLLSSVALLRCDEIKLHNMFLLQTLLSPMFQRNIQESMSGNAITRLTLEKINGFQFALPFYEEQLLISKCLNGLQEKLSKEERLCEKLKIVKQGLMRDLLTSRVRIPELMIKKFQTQVEDN